MYMNVYIQYIIVFGNQSKTKLFLLILIHVFETWNTIMAENINNLLVHFCSYSLSPVFEATSLQVLKKTCAYI